MSKNIQALHDAIFEQYEQLSPLTQLQIPTGSYVIYFGIDSNLNLPSILKGFKPCGKNLVNSIKIYLYLVVTNVNLVGHTCM
jgi:hypothetical protein